MYKHLLILVIMLGLASGVTIAQPMALSLDQALELALKNNINIQNAQEDLVKARAQRKEAFSAALPVISAFGQASHSFSIATQPLAFPIPFGVIDDNGVPVPLTDASGNSVPLTDPYGNIIPGMNLQMTGVQLVPVDLAFGTDNTMVYGINLTQPLFEGRVIAAIRGANVYGDLATSAAEVTRLSVIENTKKAFFQVLLADKMVSVMENSLEVMERNLANVTALFAQGKTAEFDVIRADVQVANQTTMVSNARKMSALAQAGLKRSCGIRIGQEIVTVGKLEVSVKADLN
ncbi:MAG: TolC family protein, partial [Candidatus Marinimicrobia bacterium]|nr:TolC family protein [Candidatus Neomarinimicrobiota bacterium]